MTRQATDYRFSWRRGGPVEGDMLVPGPDPLPPAFRLRDYCPTAPPDAMAAVVADEPVWGAPVSRVFDGAGWSDPPPAPEVVGRRVTFVGVPADPAAAARAGYRDTWSGPTPTGYRLKGEGAK